MFKSLEKLFTQLNQVEPESSYSQKELNLAIAALLVEVARIDQNLDAEEWEELQKLLVSECEISKADALSLAEEAKLATTDASSLFQFTDLINSNCSYEQKLQITAGLWKVAYADGELDKYEEHIIRRISDLIHVSHVDFIKTKIEVRDKQAD